MRALEKEPDARYATAAELALALSSCTLAGTWTFGDADYVARAEQPAPARPVATRRCLRCARRGAARMGGASRPRATTRQSASYLRTSRKMQCPVASR